MEGKRLFIETVIHEEKPRTLEIKRVRYMKKDCEPSKTSTSNQSTNTNHTVDKA